MGDHQQRITKYAAPPLRRCGAPAYLFLLRSIARAALDEDELAVRILSRAHIEAWLTGIYLHFGGNAGIERVTADTRNETEITDAAIKRR